MRKNAICPEGQFFIQTSFQEQIFSLLTSVSVNEDLMFMLLYLYANLNQKIQLNIDRIYFSDINGNRSGSDLQALCQISNRQFPGNCC